MQICGTCGAQNPEQARFCMSCSAALGAPASAAEVRKTVTVLFADLAGSTALGEHLDPEATRRVMGRYFDIARRVLERHGGTIEKFIGDAVMAVFGIPAMHEDDALRAVRGAIDLRAALKILNDELSSAYSVTLQVRTGVATGEVVAGDPALGQNLVTGEAVNLAARLEQAAGSGEILIAPTTYRLVRDAVTVEEARGLDLKGRSGVTAAFPVIGVEWDTAGVARRTDAPMVGREQEKELLEHAFRRVRKEQRPHLFTIFGAAGVGKSRLVREFVEARNGEASVVFGHCLSYGDGITFLPIAEIVKQSSGIEDSDPTEVTLKKIERVLQGEQEAAAMAELIGQVIGLGVPPASIDESSWALRRYLEVLAQRRPLVVVIEDIHWAEPALLDLIENIADWARDAPMLLVCTARPELLEHRVGWGGGKLNSASLGLEPLTSGEMSILVEHLLGSTRVETPAGSAIVASAEGNPLFVEQMLSYLIDERILARHDGTWIMTRPLEEVTVPPTIQALLGSRLDSLDAKERAVIEAASVIGREFYAAAIANMLELEKAEAVRDEIASLSRKDLIRSERPALGTHETFRFRHILIREAAYESIPKERRFNLHRSFARWLESDAGERLQEYEEIIGYHLEQAYVAGTAVGAVGTTSPLLQREAAEHLAAAGERAYARGDGNAAVNLLGRASALLSADDRVRVALLPELGAAYGDVGELDRAVATYQEAMDRAAAGGDRAVEWHARVALRSLEVSMDPGRHTVEERMEEARRALEILEEEEHHLGVALASFLLIDALRALGRRSESGAAAERAAEAARRANRPRQVADAVGLVGSSLRHGTAPYQELESFCERMLPQVSDNRLAQAWLLGSLMEVRMVEGRLAEAREFCERANAILRELGLAYAIPMTYWDEGRMARLEGRLEEAVEKFIYAGELMDRLGDTEGKWIVTVEAAEALHEAGRLDESREQLIRAEGLRDHDHRQFRAWWFTAASDLARKSGDPGAAEGFAREALATVGDTELIETQADGWLTLARALADGGRTDEAIDAARRAEDLYERKGATLYRDRARELVTELRAH